MTPTTLPSTLAGCALLAAGLLAVAPGRAQDSTKVDEVSVQRFAPAPGPDNYLAVAGSRTDGHWAWSAELMFDYARDPFVLRSCAAPTGCGATGTAQAEDLHVVQDLFTWNVLASMTPIPMLQIGLRVPVVMATGQGLDPNTGGAPADALFAVGVGDVAIEGKARFFGEPSDPVVLGAALDLAAPLGQLSAEGGYIGDAPPIVVGLRAIFDGHFGPVLTAANVGGVYRKETTVGSAALGSELRYGAAAGVQAIDSLAVFAEGFGATRFNGQTGTNSLEVLGAVRFAPPSLGLVVTGGGGAGLLPGVGAPLARGVLGVGYVGVSGTGDTDGDGIPDSADKCPSEAEDKDHIADSDGCPEMDADDDGIPDMRDECPEQPETFNKFMDEDGCPDAIADQDGDGVLDQHDDCPGRAGGAWQKGFVGCPDADGDGVADDNDKCPGELEDANGIEDDDGCPDADQDHDGVVGAADLCPTEPEVPNGIEDTDGCPDEAPDKDGDGIADDKDRCASEAEILDGVDDQDGCPERFATKLAEVTIDKVALTRAVVFDQGQITNAASKKALAALAAGLVNHPTIFLVKVTVATTEADDMLGPARADAVIAELVAKGVAKSRLVAATAAGSTSTVSFEVLWSARKKR